LKYDLIRIISDHSEAASLIPENLMIRIRTYVREGPFYVEVQPEVAFEGGNE
jgi:hypothetical protein